MGRPGFLAAVFMAAIIVGTTNGCLFFGDMAICRWMCGEEDALRAKGTTAVEFTGDRLVWACVPETVEEVKILGLGVICIGQAKGRIQGNGCSAHWDAPRVPSLVMERGNTAKTTASGAPAMTSGQERTTSTRTEGSTKRTSTILEVLLTAATDELQTSSQVSMVKEEARSETSQVDHGTVVETSGVPLGTASEGGTDDPFLTPATSGRELTSGQDWGVTFPGTRIFESGTDEEGGNFLYYLVGGIVGGVLALAFCLAGGLYYVGKKAKNRADLTDSDDIQMEELSTIRARPGVSDRVQSVLRRGGARRQVTADIHRVDVIASSGRCMSETSEEEIWFETLPSASQIERVDLIDVHSDVSPLDMLATVAVARLDPLAPRENES